MKIFLMVILWVAFKSATAQDQSWIMKTQLKTLRSFNYLPPIILTKSGSNFIADNYKLPFKHSAYFKSLMDADKNQNEVTNRRNEQGIFNFNYSLGIKKPALTQSQVTLDKVAGVVDGLAGFFLANYSQENRIIH